MYQHSWCGVTTLGTAMFVEWAALCAAAKMMQDMMIGLNNTRVVLHEVIACCTEVVVC
jgi:hypothetical protein